MADALLRVPESLLRLRGRFDDVLYGFLAARRREAGSVDARATLPVDEIVRLLRAGGKRLRPTFCYWGYRSAGGPDEDRIVTAAAALELLHTFALIHDDLMDDAVERRDVPATAVFLDRVAEERSLPKSFGRSAAILAGDVAAVLADQLFLEAGFPDDVLVRTLARYNEMRIEMAAGQLLDLHGGGADEREARRIASLKGGGYTVERPLLIGASLAGATVPIQACLSRFGAPLGEAFQLRDELVDGNAPAAVTGELVNHLVDAAVGALDADVLDPAAVDVLRVLAGAVALR